MNDNRDRRPAGVLTWLAGFVDGTIERVKARSPGAASDAQEVLAALEEHAVKLNAALGEARDE